MTLSFFCCCLFGNLMRGRIHKILVTLYDKQLSALKNMLGLLVDEGVIKCFFGGEEEET